MPADVECAKRTFNHIHKKRKDSLETRAELAVLRTFVEI